VAAALPLLRKIGPGFANNRELKAVWAINCAIATERMYRAPSEELWETAIQQMPAARWVHYPSLAVGCRNHIHHLREKHESDGDLQSLLAAMPLAERAYVAITHPTAKGSSFERSASAVRLLIELARMQHASTQNGLGPLAMPSSVELFKQAIINASVSREEEDLFARSMAALADHYSSLGDREHARDFAMQGLIECAALKGKYPKLIEALQAILHANMEPEE
jgi:muconolactone delta-isomerase